jgi:hypothetical protein
VANAFGNATAFTPDSEFTVPGRCVAAPRAGHENPPDHRGVSHGAEPAQLKGHACAINNGATVQEIWW